MLYIIIIEGLLIFIGIIYIIYNKNKYNKNSEEFQEEQKKILEANWARRQKELEVSFEQERARLEGERRKSEQGARDAQFNLVQLNREIEQKKSFNASLKEIREEELDRLIESEKEKRLADLAREVEEWAQSAQEAANEAYKMDAALYQTKVAQEQQKLSEILSQIDEFKEKRAAINQEILRSRAIEEKQDFYRVLLDDVAKRDISILNEVKSKISKVELFNKLIYDNYIAKPSREMTKRVLEGKDPTGIYKVTNIQTNEIYIGKSKTCATRWINHVKSACGLEGVADSQFQRALKKYGIENFTWELLEVCTSENLNEREKYYIEFFDSINYGYNMRKG